MNDRWTDKEQSVLARNIAARFVATKPVPTTRTVPAQSVPAVPRSVGGHRLNMGRVLHGGSTLPYASDDETWDENDGCVPLILLIGCALASVLSLIISIGTAVAVGLILL